MPVLLETLDQQIAATLSDWNVYTTLIAASIVAFLAYPIVYPSEPDTHPLLLARQASAAPVRNKNESAVYRSPEIPHGYPLKSGLNVKQPGEPRWKTGKDGDLRDIWREVLRGGQAGQDGKETPQGSIMSVFGKKEIQEHDLQKLSKQINVLGKYWKETGDGKVAIYLPNNIEYLVSIFACAFYGLTPILLPHDLAPAKVHELLNLVGADTLVTEAGTLPTDDIARECKGLRLITSVVHKPNRHMDWAGVPDSAQSRLSMSVWSDLVDEAANASATLPENDSISKLGEIVTVWQPVDDSAKPIITTFTQANIISAVAAMITSLPLRQRMTPADLLLPADSFNRSYVLCWTLAALYTHASVAINSVAGPKASLAAATGSTSPTIIIASAEAMSTLHIEATAKITSPLHKLGLLTQSQTLSAGRMPSSSLFLPPSTSTSTSPGKLRLILTSERFGADSPPLSSAQLSDLRIFTRARIVYALTAPNVAGAVAQTHVFDYRREEGAGHSRFGAPLSCVEVRVLGADDKDVGASEPTGELVVAGPAVAGGEWRSGRRFRLREDGCLGYA